MPQEFSTNLGISQQPEFSQSDYPGIFLDNLRLRQAIRILQGALDNYTGIIGEEKGLWSQVDSDSFIRLQNTTRVYALVSEALSAGAIVNFHDVGGKLNVRNANASAVGKPPRGFVNAAYTAGSYAEVFLGGVCKTIAGLTIGSTYYLSNTAGLISTTAGTLIFPVGYALGTQSLFFAPTLT